MTENYIEDIKRYRSDVNEKALAAIVKHLGIALKSPDASMVSCSSKSELERVRESWLRKKLALTAENAALDQAIVDVCTTMKGEGKKSRVTFYYLLADNLGKLGALGA